LKKEVQFLGFIFAVVIIIVMLFIGSVKAMDTPLINQRIVAAQKEVVMIENEFMEKDMSLFMIYKQNPFSEEGHQAELELREKYPDVYHRYIEAKTKLDDLKYMQFMIFANGLPEEDK
jgi:uncharacterized protein YxeA